MRTLAREAALNIIFAQQFNDETDSAFRKKVYKQFALTDEGVAFATSLVEVVLKNWEELIVGIEDACHHYRENRINPMDKTILLIAMAEIKFFDDIPPLYPFRKRQGLRENIPPILALIL